MAENSSRGLAPAHPGVFLREDVLPYIDHDAGDLARLLGIDEQALQAILDEREGLSTQIAVRLGKALGNGARFWLTLQILHDVWLAEQADKADVPRVKMSRRA